MEPIEWDRSLDDSRGARLFAYVFLGAISGLFLLVAVALVALLPFFVALLLENPAVAAVVVLFALVGGPVSLLYLWPLLTDPEQRRGIPLADWLSDLSWSGVLVAAILGALVHLAAFVYLTLSPVVVLAVGALVGSLGTGLLLTEGRIDPDDRTLTVQTIDRPRDAGATTVDLDAWTGLGRYRIGSTVVLRPSYARGSGGPRVRLLTVPVSVADAADSVFEDAIEASVPTRERESNPTVAATLAVFGLGAGGVGVAIGLLDVVPVGFRLWFAAVSGLFGALFLAAAWRER